MSPLFKTKIEFNMKQRFFCLMFLCLTCCRLFAGTVTVSTAQTVALNFFKNNATNISSPGSLTDSLVFTKSESNGTADFYVFNISPVKGFVIVSAEDNAQPILGYSTKGHFHTNFNNIGLSDWMTTAAAKISDIVQRQILPDANITSQWSAYKTGAALPSSRSSTVAPLLTTTWNQYPYYNALCPYNSADADNAVTGCVATAMAQIMKFWNFPAQGTGSYSYDDVPPYFSYNYGEQSFNFGATTFQWNNMPNAVAGPSNDTAVATLMYACGVAVAMDYGDIYQGGSGAYVMGPAPSAQAAYSTYFSYNASTMQGLSQSSYTSAQWTTLLENELLAGRPIQYEGFDPSAGGHTWVCDGFDASGLFDMNWGWGGYDDGYYNISSLSVDGYDFSSDDGALIGIEPGSVTSCGTPAGASSSSVTTNSATISWEAVSGAVSYNLEYKTSPATTWTSVSVTGTSSALTGLAAGTTYDYQVQTVCSGGSSSFSTTGSFITLTSCGTPGGLEASSITSSGATVSWEAVSGASSYNIEYQISSSSTWTIVSTTGTSLTLTGLASSTSYNYQVQCVCSSGSSAYSAAGSFTTSAAATCGIPAGLTTTSITTSEALISWGAVSGAISYNLEYKTSSASTWTTVSCTTTSENLTGLTAGTTYDYQVQTVCSSGSSAYSSEGSFTTLTSCGTPSGTSTINITSNSATITWGAVSGATSYNVKYMVVGGTAWTSASTTTNSFNISGLTLGTSYEWEVQTVCSSGTSAYTTPIDFTTPTTTTPTYCASSASSEEFEYIGNVTMGSIDNNGSATGYANYTNLSTNLTIGVPATISLTPGFTSSSYDEYFTVYIDYNQDGSFTDAGELVAEINGSAAVTASITVPATALTGPTRMRIQMQYGAYETNPCATYTFGEVEDYTVNIVSNGSCNVPSGLTASSVTTTGAAVTWDAVSGATSYNLEYKPSSSSTWTTISLTTNSENLTGLTAGTTYNYQVQTICSAGSSAYSAEGSFTTLTPCGTPTDLETSSITTESATVSWEAVSGASSYNLEYQTSSSSNWITVSTTGTSYSITGLASGTTYNFEVQTICSSGSSAYSTEGTFTTISSNEGTYCTSTGLSTVFEYINEVAFGSFSNVSGNNNGYSNYTNLVIPFASGTTKSFTLTPGYNYGSSPEYWVIYIDYNKNGVFTDPGEEVFVSGAVTGSLSGSINIPSGLSGTTVMRIAMDYSGTATPCGSYAYGETEDYTVNLSATASLLPGEDVTPAPSPVTGIPAPFIYPNPVSDQLTVVLTPVRDVESKIEILSIMGQVVLTQVPASTDRETIINVAELPAGVYLVRMTIGDRAITQKMVKQ